jgi:tetratricopeptide (TPR) repeat protein
MSQAVIAGMLCLAISILSPDQDDGAAAPRSVEWVFSVESAQPPDSDLLERWDKRAAEAQSDLEKFDVKLASANWILSRHISAAVSRVLLRTDKKEDRDQIAKALTASQIYLDDADQLWAKIVKSGDLPDAYESTRAKNLSSLRIFHDVFKSLWPAAEMTIDAREEAMREAANQLSIVLKDDRKDVLAAAQLWQGYLYVQRGKLAGALELWPRTLEPLNAPYGVNLYMRLMQCRTLVQKDQAYTAGVALILNLEQAAVRRMSDAQMGVESQATVAFVRRQFFNEWRKKLTDEGELDRAAWCSRMVEALDVDHDPGDGVVKMLPMEFAAPDFVELDKAIARLNEPVQRNTSKQSAESESIEANEKTPAASREDENTNSDEDDPEEDDTEVDDNSPDNPGG